MNPSERKTLIEMQAALEALLKGGGDPEPQPTPNHEPAHKPVRVLKRRKSMRRI
ncbi:MAG: hypothetical protein JWL86_5434 [Rhizobium sp.]|nr:hypothetical protein [Rhizobium sp.]